MPFEFIDHRDCEILHRNMALALRVGVLFDPATAPYAGLMLHEIEHAASSLAVVTRHAVPRRRGGRGDDGGALKASNYQMDYLTLFGLIAVTAMLVFYALEDHSSWFILAFAVACALGSIYGFLQGAWPFGVVEAIWASVAVWRWYKRLQT